MNTFVMAPTMLRDAAPLDYIAAAAAGGFDAIGLRVHRSLAMPTFFPIVGDAALIRDIKRAAADAGIHILEVTSFYLLPEMDFDEYKEALELGAELGAKFALLLGDDPDRSRMTENFHRLCDLAAPLGLTCAVENARRATVDQTARMVADTGVSNGAVCLDPMNYIGAGGSPTKLKAMDRKLFPYTQLADGIVEPLKPGEASDTPRRGVRKLCGEGELDLYGLLDALPAGLPISIELPIALSKDLPGANGQEMAPGAWCKFALDHTRRYIEEYDRSKKA